MQQTGPQPVIRENICFFEAYPNAGTGLLQPWTTTTKQPVRAVVFNAMGQEVEHFSIAARWAKQSSATSRPAGMYQLFIQQKVMQYGSSL